MTESYPVHKAVFQNDLPRLSSLLSTGTHDCVDEADPHGNTPLHLAVMLGRKDCVNMLIEHHAKVGTTNKSGWSALAEAISYGDRNTIHSVKGAAEIEMETEYEEMMASLEEFGDFTVELRWEMTSWVPFLSMVLPSGSCILTVGPN